MMALRLDILFTKLNELVFIIDYCSIFFNEKEKQTRGDFIISSFFFLFSPFFIDVKIYKLTLLETSNLIKSIFKLSV